MDKVDIDLIMKCAQQVGASVTIANNGDGGIYVNGKKIDDIIKFLEEVFKGRSEE